jgi:hypothetical protein
MQCAGSQVAGTLHPYIYTTYAVGVDAGRLKGFFACGSMEVDVSFRRY